MINSNRAAFNDRGITKREYMATAIIAGICSNETSNIPATKEAIVKFGLELTDHLLKQLDNVSNIT